MSGTVRDESRFGSGGKRPPAAPRTSGLKFTAFLAIGVMMVYVANHFERFLIDPSHPAWQHYNPFKWWLLPHGVAGASALILGAFQFSNRLRRRFLIVHKTIGAIYVVGVFILGPVGVVIQHMDEAQGAAQSFTWESAIQSGLLMTTTGIGLYFALRGRITQHRQWMIRSYAVALAFLEARVIIGLGGFDQPFDWHIVETIVWTCAASALLIADIANQLYERRTARPKTA